VTLRAPLRCSEVAAELDEPLAGTIDRRERWLLVEDRGAWGEKAVRDVLGAPLEAAAKERGMRLLLVRRREGDPAADAVRRVFLADAVRAEMAVRTITDVAELEPLLDVSVAEFGAPLHDPILLVCTNGKRDACCALRGRALMNALAADHAERTWECSHLGGHRFAANLVCLPHGIAYGRVAPADGPRLADAYLDGRLDPSLLRGRSAWPAPAQVAEAAVRLAEGMEGIDDVDLLDVEGHGTLATVVLAIPGGERRTVRLEAARLSPARAISCRAEELEEPLHWLAREISPGSPAPRTG
jgi:hypothetical protein